MENKERGFKTKIVKNGDSLSITIPIEIAAMFGVGHKSNVLFKTVNDQIIIYIEKPP